MKRLGLVACCGLILFVLVGLQSAARASDSARNIQLCNYTSESLDVAILVEQDMFSSDNDYTTGWYVENSEACRTITLPSEAYGVQFYAFKYTSHTEWSPGTTGHYYCVDLTNAFKADVHSGQSCYSPYTSEIFYPPQSSDINYSYAYDTWSVNFWSSEFGGSTSYRTPTPAPTAAPAATATPTPGPAQIAFNRGSELFGKGNFRAAIPFLNQAIKLSPTWGTPLIFRAQTKFDLGDYQGALRDADAAVAAEPGSPSFNVFVAESEWVLGLLDSAQTDYLKAAQHDKANGWDASWIVAASFVMRSAGHAREAQDLLAQCRTKCAHGKHDYSDVVEYLRGALPAQTMCSHYAQYKGECASIVAYNLILDHKRAQAAPYIRMAMAATQIGPWTVPKPVLRRAANM